MSNFKRRKITVENEIILTQLESEKTMQQKAKETELIYTPQIH